MRIPILCLGKILLTSFQDGLTDRDIIDLQHDLLEMVSKTEIENLLNVTARMVKILGAEVVISGIQPLVALTLVEIGQEALKVKTALNLERGLAMLNCTVENTKPSTRKPKNHKKNARNRNSS
jgi:rsbT antagonist protein RsbS